jgi:hypothetical protein
VGNNLEALVTATDVEIENEFGGTPRTALIGTAQQHER